MYYDEDFYNEPSEYDQMVEEFRDSLMKSVKQDFIDKMNRLEKENAELREVKENWESMKRSYEQKNRELAYKLEQERQNMRRERLAQLFEQCGMNVVLFKPKASSFQMDKCDKCDKDRHIHFKSPSGKDMTENCACAKWYYPFSPVSYRLVKFHRSYRHDTPICAFYQDESTEDYDYYDEMTPRCKNLYAGQPFDELYESAQADVFFENEDQCRAYCDYLNKVKKIPKKILERLNQA